MAETFSPYNSESDRLAAVTLVDPEEALLKGFKCRNPACGEVIGFTNGQQLYSGALIISLRTRVMCGYCGFHMEWRPVIQPIKKQYED